MVTLVERESAPGRRWVEHMTKLSVYSRDGARAGMISASANPGLDGVVAQLRISREDTHNIRRGGRIRKMPSRAVLATIAEQLIMALFPTHYGSLDLTEDGVDKFVSSILGHALRALAQHVRLDLELNRDDAESSAEISEGDRIASAFAAQLPAIRALLVSDLVAAYENDPAATTYPEILLGYPGMIALAHHRLAHALFRLGATLSARVIASIAHSKTAIDIHPGAEIGSHFFIDHGTGVVIGETAVIGSRVRLYQGVTLGARNFPTDENGVVIKGAPRHPIVEDDVVIYGGATILGRITIGRGSVIGGNVWLTESVPPGSHISQARLRNE
jgi:serine O-acetyltransferase